jgi:hypothetical protein
MARSQIPFVGIWAMGEAWKKRLQFLQAQAPRLLKKKKTPASETEKLDKLLG